MTRRVAALATAALLLVAVVLPGPATATGGGGGSPGNRPLVPRVVATFVPGELGSFAESVAADRSGTLYVSVTNWMPDGVSNAGQIWTITRNGRLSPFGQPLDAGGALLTGLAFDESGQLYVGDWTGGHDMASGVFRVSSHGPPVRVLTLPDSSIPNALAFHAGFLYVSDSTGAIWRVRPCGGPGATPATPWLEDRVLAPVSGWEGVNGIAFQGDALYAENADTGSVVRIPVRRDGSPGVRSVVVTDPALIGADGIAFDVDGDLWIAVNHADLDVGGALVRMSRSGQLRVVANDPAWLDYPSQPVFGTLPGDRTTLYVVNGSLNTGSPNVIALDVGVRGQPLP